MKGQNEGCCEKRKSLWKGDGRLLEGFWKVSPQSPCDKRPATKNLLALNMTCHLQDMMYDV